jgi:ribosomal protein L12E/L44/L45/RPP1/RPP2
VATKNLKELVDLFVSTAAKYQKEPLGPFAAKMATLTAHVFRLTERVGTLDRVVATLMMKQQQETAAAGAPAAPAPVATAPKAPAANGEVVTPEEEEQDESFNDIERETAAELASVSPLRKPANEAMVPTAKEAS